MEGYPAVWPGTQPREAALVSAVRVITPLLLMWLALAGLGMTESDLAASATNLTKAFHVAEAGIESLFVDLFDTTLPPGTPYATVMIRGRWQG